MGTRRAVVRQVPPRRRGDRTGRGPRPDDVLRGGVRPADRGAPVPVDEGGASRAGPASVRPAALRRSGRRDDPGLAGDPGRGGTARPGPGHRADRDRQVGLRAAPRARPGRPLPGRPAVRGHDRCEPLLGHPGIPPRAGGADRADLRRRRPAHRPLPVHAGPAQGPDFPGQRAGRATAQAPAHDVADEHDAGRQPRHAARRRGGAAHRPRAARGPGGPGADRGLGGPEAGGRGAGHVPAAGSALRQPAAGPEHPGPQGRRTADAPAGRPAAPSRTGTAPPGPRSPSRSAASTASCCRSPRPARTTCGPSARRT